MRVNWRHKAAIMRACAAVPGSDRLYKFIQKRWGRLDANPRSRLTAQSEMLRWLNDAGTTIEGSRCVEVGTGHIPVVPIGFYLSGASEVITLDLHPRVDWKLTSGTLHWITQNREELGQLYGSFVAPRILRERLDSVAKYREDPKRFCAAANIVYRAPADAGRTTLSAHSVDVHFSVTVLEHIAAPMIPSIFLEAKRILRKDGVALHFIDPSDHFNHTDDSISAINFLRFSENEWMRIAGNEFAYCNRLRASDYLAMFEKLSWLVLRREAHVDAALALKVEQGFPVDAKFSSYTSEDICTTSINLMLRPCSAA